MQHQGRGRGWGRAYGVLALGCGVPLLAGCSDDAGGGASETPSVVLEGDFTVTSREALAELKGATKITGSLTIHGPDVASLTGLESLQSVGGDLRIVQTALSNLQGLNALTHVEEFFWVESNASLINLSGVRQLTTTGWSTVVRGNFELLSLEGLDGLKAVTGQLSITDNIKLASITALAKLETLGDNLSVYNNFSIPECEVDDVLRRLTANGWTGTATINGLKSCTGTCNGPVCTP